MGHTKLLRVAILAGCTALTGCATNYGKADIFGLNGYQDKQLEPNLYELRMSCNDHTSSEHCEAMLRYRAAEITLENGYDFFIFQNGKPRHNPLLSLKYDFEEVIKLGKGSKPSGNDWAFDANEVKKNLQFVVQK